MPCLDLSFQHAAPFSAVSRSEGTFIALPLGYGDAKLTE